jgi:hypothetical protein
MALARGRASRFDGDGYVDLLEVCPMRGSRFLPLLLAVLSTFVALGVVFAFTRPIKWPANVRAIDWRRAVGAATGPATEVEVAA